MGLGKDKNRRKITRNKKINVCELTRSERMQNILTRNFINHFALKTLTPQFSNLLPFLSYKFFIFRERLNNVDVSVNPNDAIVCVTGFLLEAKWDM